ncbi:hypothetical protein ACIBQ1_52530 [Nonomuraea sp. NPDC050153]|uniref:hypothetical protein n=1 Tax=Nonomuraea sp. NPDC050153 TaxID=3364359 RepID=UPI00378728C5
MIGMMKVLVGAAVLAGGLAVASVPAEAAVGPINYSCGPRIDTPRSGRQVDRVSGYNVRLFMKANAYGGRDIYFVKGYGLRPGDKVSLDWSDTKGRTYHACHGTVHRGRTGAQTWAIDDPGGYRSFRACVKTRGSWHCTYWGVGS